METDEFNDLMGDVLILTEAHEDSFNISVCEAYTCGCIQGKFGEFILMYVRRSRDRLGDGDQKVRRVFVLWREGLQDDAVVVLLTVFTLQPDDPNWTALVVRFKWDLRVVEDIVVAGKHDIVYVAE